MQASTSAAGRASATITARSRSTSGKRGMGSTWTRSRNGCHRDRGMASSATTTRAARRSEALRNVRVDLGHRARKSPPAAVRDRQQGPPGVEREAAARPACTMGAGRRRRRQSISTRPLASSRSYWRLRRFQTRGSAAPDRSNARRVHSIGLTVHAGVGLARSRRRPRRGVPGARSATGRPAGCRPRCGRRTECLAESGFVTVIGSPGLAASSAGSAGSLLSSGQRSHASSGGDTRA